LLLKKVKAEGLAHLSYLVGGTCRAAVIDPRRDCQAYLDIADEADLRITHILETHRNEDYVTGSRELQAVTGARILHGALEFGYGELVREGDQIDLGVVVLKALSTPGHTPESMSYVLYDTTSGPPPVGVFTGDTLFVGEVGRTDLMGNEVKMALASQLYDSLHEKLVPLGPSTIVYPAHGAGSACGGSISNREESTIGQEMEQNRALRMSRDVFMAMKEREVMEKPYYFTKMEEVNLAGQPVLGSWPSPPLLSPSGLREAMSRGAAVLDVRPPTSFAGGHIPGSISIPGEVVANYAGWMLKYGTPIALVADGLEGGREAVRALIRTGYEAIVGRLAGGVEAWAKAGMEVASLPLITPSELHCRLAAGEDITILDVRTGREREEEWVEGSMHIFAGYLTSRMAEVPRGRPVAIMCSSGLRGSLGASILKPQGLEVINVLGGMGGWKRSGLPTVNFREP
jgi:hydroxyacylglutathione hydrolase